MARFLMATGLCIALGMAAGGCTWARQRTNVADFHQKVESVIPGTTRADQLKSILGTEPNTRVNAAGGKTIYVYNFGDAKTKGLTLLLINISKTNVGGDTAYLVVNRQGVVEEMFISSNSKDLPWEFWAFGD